MDPNAPHALQLDELLTAIPALVCRLTGAGDCTLYTIDARDGSMETAASTSLVWDIAFRPHEGLPGEVARSGQALFLDHGSEDPRYVSGGRRAPRQPIRNALYVPLRDFFGRPFAVLELHDKGPALFADSDVQVVELFGRYAAVALQCALGASSEQERGQSEGEGQHLALLEKLQRSEMMRQVESAFQDSDDLAAILGRILDRAAEALGAGWAAATLLDETGHITYLGPCTTHTPESLRRLASAPDDGLAAWVLQNRRAAFSNGSAQDARFSEPAARELSAVRGLAAAPLVSENTVLGVVVVGDHWGPGFAEIDLKLLDFLVGHTAGVLRKRLLLEQARGAQRLAAVGAVAARIIHDIKQPVSTLKLIAYDLKQGDVAPDRQSKHARLMESSLKYLVGLTQEVLDFSRGELKYEIAQVALGPLLAQQLEHLREECAAAGTELVTEIAHDAVVSVDADRFRRVVQNLATNAIEAMGQGGRLEIRATIDGDGVELVLADSGPGIPQEIQERLFRPFVTHGKRRGTGLGLAICKTIVEAHGGRIGAMNNPDRGACFTIWLPLARS